MNFNKILFISVSILISINLSAGDNLTIEDAKKNVERIGKLHFRHDVPVRYFSRLELEQYLTEYFTREYSAEMGEKESLFFYTMGFTDAPLEVRAIRHKILLANASGIYNEKTQELLLLEEFKDINMLNAMVIVHELRHAVIDQHFNLQRLLGTYSDFDDRKLALLSTIEGDASFLMVKANDFNIDVLSSSLDANTLLSFSPVGSSVSSSQAPEIIKYQIIMPYLDGLRFIDYLFKKKNWSGINGILSKPPQSSEQILHPEKYLKNEKPIQIEISYMPEGYIICHQGVIGEYFLNLLLKTGDEWYDFAASWGGDLFQIYKKEDNYFLIWESAWDNQRSCREFFFAFEKFSQKKYNLTYSQSRTPSPFQASHSKDGYFFLSKKDNKIFYVRTNDRIQINKFINGGLYD